MRPIAVALALAAALLIAPGTTRAAGRARPNVVVIVADDMGFADAGFQGSRDIPTPNLDALARSGVRCSNGYVSGPYCSPTRAGLLTGRYQQRFGHEFNPGNRAASAEVGLPTSETTLVERLRAAGYATGLVGKWHLGVAPKFHPQKRGFEEFFGFLGGAHVYFAAETRNVFRGTEVVVEESYLTDAFGREAAAFVDRQRGAGRPFFLELAFNAVHTPMNATKGRLARFATIRDERRRAYAAMLSALDDAVGTLTAKLRDSGLEDDTLIVFISDNGGPTMLGTTVNGSINAPFRGSKQTTLEGGIRVPFLASWKGRLPAGRVYDRPVIQLDILPTALAAAGVPLDPAWTLDGVDLLPFLSADPGPSAPPHDALFWRFGAQDAVRRGDWKLVRYTTAADTGGRAGPAVPPTPRRLYNLASDPGEARDLAAENPAKVAELLAAWQAWNAQLIPPRWGPPGAAGNLD